MNTKPDSKLLEIISMARQAGIGSINGTLLIEMERDGAPELEKFAELIVRECAWIASDYNGTKYVGDEIKQHFGVE